MAEIPLHWREYAAYQSDLRNRTSVNAASWGIEAGLNYLLEGDNLSKSAPDVARVVASAARRDRYGRALLAKHIILGAEMHDSAGQIEARSALARLQRKMPTEKLDLLVELASGAPAEHLAANHGIAIGALRTRAARARQLAREMAA